MFDLDDENRLISSSMKVEDNDTEVSLRPKNVSDVYKRQCYSRVEYSFNALVY